MITDGEFINKDNFDTTSYFSSFEDKYIIFDNLEKKTEPIIPHRNEVYNSLYVYVIVVLNGTLNINVNSTELQIHSNEYLTIMPCTKFRVKESRCTYFAYATQAYLTNTIYNQIGMLRDLYTHCFTFHHHRFSNEQIQRFKSVYLMAKREHGRNDFIMKEYAIRAIHVAYYSQLHTFLENNQEINHYKNTRQEQIFKDFLILLDNNYQNNRAVNFYAQKLNITPKYLSSTTISFTGISASKIIDDFVVFQIKQQLYNNIKSVKEISKSLNFQSQSFFGRYFKRITGMSPREYINKYSIKAY